MIDQVGIDYTHNLVKDVGAGDTLLLLDDGRVVLGSRAVLKVNVTYAVSSENAGGY